MLNMDYIRNSHSSIRRCSSPSRNSFLVWLSSTILLLLIQSHVVNSQAIYANITLQANDGDLSVVVYLPKGIDETLPTYYQSSRFEHGSMIGSITRYQTYHNPKDGTETKRRHVLYGSRNWRVPHDSYWPESGVGLASEFGVGDDGAFCNWRCGWYGVNDVTNGILGYEEASNGESFLRLGVGELIKGSCHACDSSAATDDFKFNSPYKFANVPVWTLVDERPTHNSIILKHEATLNQYGYRLTKNITLKDDQLLVKSTLTNTGRVPFATAWFSHHLFTCDSRAVGTGYNVDLDLTGTDGAYEEPGTWFWSTPLRDYAKVTPRKDRVSVQMQRGVEQNVRIKAEFDKDEKSTGGFILKACDTSIRETIPEIGTEGGVSMYAYNLYIESGTFSPEPQIYMHLWPGQSSSWTQQLDFEDWDPTKPESKKPSWLFPSLPFTKLLQGTVSNSRGIQLLGLGSVLFAMSVAHTRWRRRSHSSRHLYSPIPETA